MSYPGPFAANTVYVKSGGLWVAKPLAAANGIATLDGTGKVPSAQIPSGGGGGTPPQPDANSIGMWQFGEGLAAASWPNHATGSGFINATLTSKKADLTTVENPYFNLGQGAGSFFGDQTNYPSLFNVNQEGGPRALVATAPTPTADMTVDCYFRPFPSSQNDTSSEKIIFGYRKTTGNVASIVASDWSFCIFQGQDQVQGIFHWGFCVTLSSGNSYKISTTSWTGGPAGFGLAASRVHHIGVRIYQAGATTNYQAMAAGVAHSGAQLEGSAQTLAFTNSREVVVMAGYPSTAARSAYGHGSNFHISNILRPQSYFSDAAKWVM